MERAGLLFSHKTVRESSCERKTFMSETMPENVMATTETAPEVASESVSQAATSQVFRMVDARTPASQTKDARGGSCGCGGCGCGGKGKKRREA